MPIKYALDAERGDI